MMEESFSSQTHEKLNFENLCYNFKIICADTLLFLNYLTEINHLSQLNTLNISNLEKSDLKSNIKKKLGKQCTIEFSTKKLNFYENLIEGNRYQIGLFNLGKPAFCEKHLKLKANDSTKICEMKINIQKKDNMYVNMMKDLSTTVGLNLEERDISHTLYDKKYLYDKFINEEFSFVGTFLQSAKIDGRNYLVFANKFKNLVLVKISEENFYDMTNLTKQKICYFKNLIFQIVYYYDGKLVTFKNQIYDKNYDDKSIVIYMESSLYSVMKVGSFGRFEDVGRAMMKEKFEYDSGMLEGLIKCIS
jgi:hypothetical protein